MKYLKLLVLAVLIGFTCSSANAQTVVVKARVGAPVYHRHRRVVVVRPRRHYVRPVVVVTPHRYYWHSRWYAHRRPHWRNHRIVYYSYY